MYPGNAGISHQNRIASRKRRRVGRCSHSSGSCQAYLHFYATLDEDLHVWPKIRLIESRGSGV